MKKILLSLTLAAASLTAFANGGVPYASSFLNRTIGSLVVTNTIGITNIITQAVQTNGPGCNTNYNYGGILFSNLNSIGGSTVAGNLYITEQSALACSTVVTNGTPGGAVFFSTNDPTQFFLDVSVPCDGTAHPLTNCSLVVDFAATTIAANSTNIDIVLAPIYYGSLNEPGTRVDTSNLYRYSMFVTASTTNRNVIGKPLSAITGGPAWDGVIGWRVLSLTATTASASYTIFGIRLTGFNPLP